MSSIGSFAPDRRRTACDLPRGQGGRRCTDSSYQPGRALVLYRPQQDTPGARVVTRRHAPFLAQLIATAGGFPQTRGRRRADPETGAMAYARVLAPLPAAARGRSV